MRDDVTNALVQRVQMTHGWIRKITKDLTDEQFAWRLGPTTPPPIGWHLWHISRWADRLQASFPNQAGNPDRGMWESEGIAAQWELKPALLGLLETGVLMDRPAASLLPEVGKEKLLEYARRTFATADEVLGALDIAQFYEARKSILAIKLAGETAVAGPGADTTVAGDVAFHLSHAGRHLGMMEVIRGMQGLRGTATI